MTEDNSCELPQSLEEDICRIKGPKSKKQIKLKHNTKRICDKNGINEWEREKRD